MSRIGRKVIQVPEKVKVAFSDGFLKVSGPKGELTQNVREGIEFEIKEKEILVKRKSDTKKLRAFHGLYRSLLNNMIIGVNAGFTRKLELNGVGYRAQASGNTINLQVGFSHPVKFELPKGVTCEITDSTNIVLSGFDKQLVGQTAAEIRKVRPPEPYKKKGIKYAEETIRTKAGKSAK
ncbi:MAG: 50S ribosomal protein L6 [Spirochaetota bacterium]|nr:50S ribosomal protein L6 [Spirochaetota bacterium]